MKSLQDQKLLLVAHYAPPVRVGAGVVMYHLLKNVPSSLFAILTEKREVSPEQLSLDRHSLQVPYYFYDSTNSNPTVATVGGQHEDGVPLQLLTLRRKIFLFIRKIPGIRLIGQLIVVARHIQAIVRAGNEAVANEKPTTIIGYSDGGPVLIASYILSIKHRLPLVLFFYDLYKGNSLTTALNIYARIFEPLLLHRARHIFVMNDLLRDVYIKRSKSEKVTVIYNSLPDTEHATHPAIASDRAHIAYLGSVYWAQEAALKDLIKAASLLKPVPVIHLYTPYSKEYLNSIGIFESDDVLFDTCSPAEAIKELEKHNLTFLGLSHTAPERLLINTSSPVRLCDYLHARVPMLIHAPAESFVVTHALTHNFAFVSTQAGGGGLSLILKEALESDERAEKVKNANRMGKTLHNPQTSARIFLDTIEKVLS